MQWGSWGGGKQGAGVYLGFCPGVCPPHPEAAACGRSALRGVRMGPGLPEHSPRLQAPRLVPGPRCGQ